MSDQEVTLSQAERIWLRLYLDQSNPETFMNGSECVRRSPYKAKTYGAIASQAHRIKKKCLPLIEKWMDEVGMSPAALKCKLMEGLEAMETKMFAYQGEVVTTKTVIPWGVRHDFLKLAMQSKGMLITKAELTGRNGGPIEGAVDHFVMFPAGPMSIEEWEAQCAAADKAKAESETNPDDTGPDDDPVGATTRPAG